MEIFIPSPPPLVAQKYIRIRFIPASIPFLFLITSTTLLSLFFLSLILPPALQLLIPLLVAVLSH